MMSLNKFLFAGLSLWALGCSGTVTEAPYDGAVDGPAADDPVTDTPPAVDTPPSVDTDPPRDAPVTETSCGATVRLEGFAALRPEHCSGEADLRIVDAGARDVGASSDVGSAAPRPPDSGVDGGTGIVPVRPDSGMVEDLPAPDAAPPEDAGTPEPCDINCALACRDVVVSNNGNYARFWTTGTCARAEGGRVSCVTFVTCP